jgi:hypothetical protein
MTKATADRSSNAPSTNSGARKIDILSLTELCSAVLLSALVLFLLDVRAMHAGALWRDEAAAVQLAQMPTLHDVAANFQHEAFPLPFPLTLRIYTSLFGDTDFSLRCFGFVVGVAMLAVAWFNSRALGAAGPVVFLALFGLNNLFVIWGSSLRGYGLGSAFVLLTVGLAAKAVRDGTRQNAIAATFAAVASVQFLLNSLPLIAAIAAAAFFVFILERKFREARLVCLCALIPALSFLPYLKSYLGADWTIVLKLPVATSLLWEKFQQALAGEHLTIGLLWQSAAALLLLIGLWYVWTYRSKSSSEARSLRFMLAFILLSMVAYGVFLRMLSYATRSWYYLPLICAVAGGVDLVSGLLSRMLWMRTMRIGIGLLFVILTPLTLQQLREPFTNIDAVARKLEAEAAANDLIVVNPWHFGPSFYRYYHGVTPWITSPTMNEHRIHRYDLMKAKMIEPDPLSDVRSAIRETLQSYHRVWIVGGARPAEEGLPTTLGPPPHPQLGWAGYMSFWSIELGTFLNQHVAAGEVVIDRPQDSINVENVPLLVASGWQD